MNVPTFEMFAERRMHSGSSRGGRELSCRRNLRTELNVRGKLVDAIAHVEQQAVSGSNRNRLIAAASEGLSATSFSKRSSHFQFPEVEASSSGVRVEDAR